MLRVMLIFTFLVEALEEGKPVSEADLAKLEHTALSGSMPPSSITHSLSIGAKH